MDSSEKCTAGVARDEDSGQGEQRRHGIWFLTMASLGVVFGDIGTSPLYSLREAFSEVHRIPLDQESVLGMLSLVFWALTLVICVKYMAVVMRADNRGEGGILSLMALIRTRKTRPGSRRPYLVILGLFGAALLYGDGMITPAISVLSAVEGLSVGTKALEPFVIPITVVILIALFVFQSKGTSRIGAVFGPVMVLWFAVIAVLGVVSIVKHPQVLAAVNPVHAVRFFCLHGVRAFLVLGAIILVVTGGEALYADIGHFGRRPIYLSWFWLVFPCLLLNYFGQGALLLTDPRAAANPFFHLAPAWALFPLVALATVATIIASQAVITGAFSLSRQAVQLGYSPRLAIRHTSAWEIGQIYVPSVNWILMVSSIALVLAFRTSTSMAAAYGLAVAGTMTVTTLLAFSVMRRRWKWHPAYAVLVTASFLVVDLSFLGANVTKIPSGGWVALAAGVVGYFFMSTWKRGREILAQRLKERFVPFARMGEVLDEVVSHSVVPGAAVYLTASPDVIPPTFQFNLKHNKVHHGKVIFLTMVTAEVPRVPDSDRISVASWGENFFRVTGTFGFMETPTVPHVFRLCSAYGLDVDMGTTTFFMGRETLIVPPKPVMSPWRTHLFILMSRNAATAAKTFGVPPERVVEIGVQIEL